MATVFWPAISRVERQLIVISDSSIKEEVEERLLGTAVDLKRGVIGSYLIGSINAFYEVIIHINKLQYRQPLPSYIAKHLTSLSGAARGSGRSSSLLFNKG